jgi:hypothetical protein
MVENAGATGIDEPFSRALQSIQQELDHDEFLREVDARHEAYGIEALERAHDRRGVGKISHDGGEAGFRKTFFRGLVASQTRHLMTGIGQESREPASDKTRGTDHQYAHAAILRSIERIP